MRRFWVQAGAVTEDGVSFENDSYHHVIDVCRQHLGCKFEVLMGDGRAQLCELTEVNRSARRARARILQSREIAPPQNPRIRLLVAMSRFATMDAIVEKAVELGVSSFQPFFSEHSFVRGPDKLSGSKLTRWQKIIENATQQTGRGTLMNLVAAQTLGAALASLEASPNAKGLCCFEGECVQTVKQGLQTLRSSPPEELWVFVGSEGGFSEPEVQLFKQFQLQPLSLGSQILRVETACVTLLSVIKYEFDL